MLHIFVETMIFFSEFFEYRKFTSAFIWNRNHNLQQYVLLYCHFWSI